MTNLNEATIAAPSNSPKGTQIAITDISTSGSGQLLMIVPGDEDQWAEVTIEAVNIDASAAFCVVLYVGASEDSNSVIKKLDALSGVSTIIDGRLLRGGTRISGRCLNGTASGGGTSGKINVYMRPPLLYSK